MIDIDQTSSMFYLESSLVSSYLSLAVLSGLKWIDVKNYL